MNEKGYNPPPPHFHTANELQIGGDHYRGKAECPHCGKELQHWDIAWAYKFDLFQYIITKWIFRWRDKGGVDDLKKARHAIDKYIEKAESSSKP